MKQQNLLVIGVVLLFLVLGGGFIFNQGQQGSKTVKTDEQMEEKKEEITTNLEYSGKVLAGKSSPFLEYNQSDYEKARNTGKIIFLDFYANWCPVCRGEAPEIKSGFDSLTSDKVIGFRVNYNDPNTDENEKKLAEEFKIPYQHTKVILKNGKEVLKDGEVWDREKFLEEINKYL